MFISGKDVEIYLLSCISNAKDNDERDYYEHLYSLYLCNKYSEMLLENENENTLIDWKGDEW